MRRCWPLENDDRRMMDYHDGEWGRPVHDDRRHFEMLILDAFQAGLSWRTILNKRENFRKAFSHFNPKAVAKYDGRKIKKLMGDVGIVRNRLKIRAAVQNAKAFLGLQKDFGTFDQYIWQFTNGKTIQNHWRSLKQLPARSKESDAMSRDLKKRGFTFVGSTICYAYMQAAGLVNDHLVGCPVKKRCGNQ
jgi:DNA-3-methyladenine glycosylase I